jgi:tetratricopeptide (TPR) repeat protein
MGLDPGPVRRPRLWGLVGLAATGACAATMFFCQYAFPFFVWLIFFLVFGVVFYVVGDIPGSGRRDWLLVVMLAVLVLLTPNLSVSHFRWGWFSPDLRRIVWSGALRMFAGYPVLGGGLGSLLILFPSYRNPDYHLYQISSITPSTRNSFLDLLVETGLLGFVAYLLLLAVLLIPAIRWVFRHPDVRMRCVLLAAAAGVLGLLTCTLLYPGGRLATGASSLWMGMGFLGGLAIQARRTARLPLAEAAQALSPDQPPVVEGRAGVMFPRWLAHAALWLALVILPLSIAHSYRFLRGRICAERGTMKMQLLDMAIPQDSSQREKMLGDLHQAAEDFEAAVAWDPTLLTAYNRLGAVWTRLAQIEESRMKDHAGAGGEREAEEAQVVHDLEQARSAYERLAKLAPDYSDIHRVLAGVYRLFYDNLMRRADQSPPGTELKEEAQRYAQLALDQMERMSRLSTNISVAEFVRETAGDLGQSGGALTAFKAASDLYPNDKELAEKYLKSATDTGDTSAVVRAKQRLARVQATPTSADGATSEPARKQK